MEPLTIGFATASALGSAGQFASRLMGASARQEEIQQRIRALEQKKEFTLSLATARAAASGISLASHSVDTYIAGLAEQFDLEMLNLRRSGRSMFAADLLGAGAGLLGDAGRLGLGLKGVT